MSGVQSRWPVPCSRQLPAPDRHEWARPGSQGSPLGNRHLCAGNLVPPMGNASALLCASQQCGRRSRKLWAPNALGQDDRSR